MCKKINYEFVLLQAIGIILVVLGHSGGISLFTDWFPAYSFHMPLFIFISGYFFNLKNEQNVKKYIYKKVQKLLIPYFLCNLVYGIIINILRYYNVVQMGSKININSLFIAPWIDGHQFAINVASWFVPALFIVHIVYIISRRIFKIFKIKNEFFILSIFMLIGCYGIFLANKGYRYGLNLIVVRTMFLIPFYQIGYLYKTELEGVYKISTIYVFTILFSVQALLFKKYGDITFGTVFCDFNKENVLLPYITSVTGIVFWLRICKILTPILKENKYINSIGQNTWTIMMHHQFVFFVINFSIYKLSSLLKLQSFNIDAFKQNTWYIYDAGEFRLTLFYVVLGVVVPLEVKSKINKLKNIKEYRVDSLIINKFYETLRFRKVES